MTVCILGNSLTALTLAKALVNQNIYVNIITNKKISNNLLVVKLINVFAKFFIFIKMNQI